MIRTERVEGSTDLVRTYSDTGMMIIQDGTGDMYSEAIDPDYMNRTYTESNIHVETEEEISDTDALNIIMGRGMNEPSNSGDVPQED